MAGYYAVAGPLLGLLDAETAHGLALGALKRGIVPRPAPFEDPRLRIRLWGMDFASPVGLAAVQALPLWSNPHSRQHESAYRSTHE